MYVCVHASVSVFCPLLRELEKLIPKHKVTVEHKFLPLADGGDQRTVLLTSHTVHEGQECLARCVEITLTC